MSRTVKRQVVGFTHLVNVYDNGILVAAITCPNYKAARRVMLRAMDITGLKCMQRHMVYTA